MGFPNVDLFLCKTFAEQFAAVQDDPTDTLDDLFEDLTAAERTEIATYLQGSVFTRDLRNRHNESDDQRRIYIVPSFPMFDLPFPQIGVSLGSENTDTKFLGDYTGEATAVTDTEGKTIAWDIPHGYYASANWNIDVVCSTKDEAIWLSRLCQLFVCRSLADLDAAGVVEVAIATADMKLEQEHFPHIVFNRRVMISGKAANTWKKRISAVDYQPGTNLALDTP